jgi:hypothetical protein
VLERIWNKSDDESQGGSGDTRGDNSGTSDANPSGTSDAVHGEATSAGDGGGGAAVRWPTRAELVLVGRCALPSIDAPPAAVGGGGGLDGAGAFGLEAEVRQLLECVYPTQPRARERSRCRGFSFILFYT